MSIRRKQWIPEDTNLTLPHYTYYSNQPRTGRMLVSPEYQIPYLKPINWKEQEEPEKLDGNLSVTNPYRRKCLDLDYEEDGGTVVPTMIPVTYQLPLKDKDVDKYVKGYKLNEIDSNLSKIKDDVNDCIKTLLRRGTFYYNKYPFYSCKDDCGTKNSIYYISKKYEYNPEAETLKNIKYIMRPVPVSKYFDNKPNTIEFPSKHKTSILESCSGRKDCKWDYEIEEEEKIQKNKNVLDLLNPYVLKEYSKHIMKPYWLYDNYSKIPPKLMKHLPKPSRKRAIKNRSFSY